MLLMPSQFLEIMHAASDGECKMPIEPNATGDLVAENLRRKKENGDLLRALHALTQEDFPINREELLAHVGKARDFNSFLEDLEARYVSQ
jgi:hypothetical protein